MTRRSTRPGTATPPYELVAKVYDQVYAWKDYAAECRSLRALIRRFGPPRARTLLDVACGTGTHLRYLSHGFDAVGPHFGGGTRIIV